MTKLPRRRPFDNFKTAVTDPGYFFGRKEILDNIRSNPYLVRIVIGGRRFGKSSLLRAIEWTLLDEDRREAFPVLVNLDVQQPETLNNFRYILVLQLRRSWERWREVALQGLRNTYRQYLGQIVTAEATIGVLKVKVKNPEYERQLSHEAFESALLDIIQEVGERGFGGVCFLLDEAEFVVRRKWADDAWSYFRGLKHDVALGKSLGLVVSGYRAVKEYANRVGSPLANIAEIVCLDVLGDPTIEQLVSHRAQIEGVRLEGLYMKAILEWAGGHPYITQQLLSSLIDSGEASARAFPEKVIRRELVKMNHNFSAWWNADGQGDGCGVNERLVYSALAQVRSAGVAQLADLLGLSSLETEDALDVLSMTGVVRKLAFDRYAVGARLFHDWVQQRYPGPM